MRRWKTSRKRTRKCRTTTTWPALVLILGTSTLLRPWLRCVAKQRRGRVLHDRECLFNRRTLRWRNHRASSVGLFRFRVKIHRVPGSRPLLVPLEFLPLLYRLRIDLLRQSIRSICRTQTRLEAAHLPPYKHSEGISSICCSRRRSNNVLPFLNRPLATKTDLTGGFPGSRTHPLFLVLLRLRSLPSLFRAMGLLRQDRFRIRFTRRPLLKPTAQSSDPIPQPHLPLPHPTKYNTINISSHNSNRKCGTRRNKDRELLSLLASRVRL